MNDLSPSRLRLTLTTIAARALDVLDQPDKAQALQQMLASLWTSPGPEDSVLVHGAKALGLSAQEAALLALGIAIETEPDIAHKLSALQDTEDAFRPTPSLLASVSGALGGANEVAALLRGALFRHHLFKTMPSRLPIALAPVAVSDAVLAVMGLPSVLPIPKISVVGACPATFDRTAKDLTARLGARPVCIILRGGAPGDQRTMAAALARSLGGSAVMPGQDAISDPSFGPALTLGGKVIVEDIALAPGSRATLAPLNGYDAPRIVLAGRDGGIDAPGRDVVDLSVPEVSDAERLAIWSDVSKGRALCPKALGPASLTAIGTRMQIERQGYRAAAGAEARGDMEPHGRLQSVHVEDDALILSDGLKAELALLLERCRQRRAGKDTLGPAYHAQGKHHGVRAMLSGTSGGGKTLACSWLATKLDMPLFKVDLASVTSKYIGETEEHVARVLDRAEAADVILLFDEADSLFGARTEARDSTDRFANNQTNYLLTRIESHNGIVLLTTNARQRIDTAFARRIDQVIDIPSPDARQRIALWQAHLGDAAHVTAADLTRLANKVDVSGGHIRAITNTAAVIAGTDRRAIGMNDIARATTLHFRGIGRTPPSGLEVGS